MSQARQQIEAAWPWLGHDGLLVTTKVGKRMVTRRFYTPEALVGYVERLDGALNTDVYYHTNPTPEVHDRKAASEDVPIWRKVLVDIDPQGDVVDMDAVQAQVLRTIHKLNPDLFASALIIDSGRGRQLLLCFWPWIHLNTPGDRRRAESAAANFLRQLGRDSGIQALGCAIDPCTSDLSRLARLPGTRNSKTGRMARFISEPSGSYFAAAHTFMQRWAASDTPPAEPMQPPADGVWSLRKVLGRITGKAGEFLAYGWESPGRRGAVVAAAASLAESGVPRDVALGWVIDANRMSKPKPLTRQELDSPFTNGWERGLRNAASRQD